MVKKAENGELQTASGRRLSPGDVERLVERAERGFDLTTWHERQPRHYDRLRERDHRFAGDGDECRRCGGFVAPDNADEPATER